MSHSDKLSKLKNAKTLQDLADVINVPLQSLTYALHGMHRLGINKYNSFPIPKKSGGVRIINSPVKELKDVQKKLSQTLYDCYNEMLIVSGYRGLDKKGITISHGFIKNKSIITNAECHRNRRFILNLDLECFFGSIHYGRVYGFFKTNKHFGLHDLIAHALANLICYTHGLPQGAPTSPLASNFIAHILDIRLTSLSKKHGLYYTRYADDLTFSTNKKIFPADIAYLEAGKTVIGFELNKIINKHGFSVNSAKTRLQFNDSRQDVTGLIVNKKVNIRKEYVRAARVLANKLFNNKVIYRIESKKTEDDICDINYLIGVMAFIYNVRQSQLIRVSGDKSAELKNFTKKEIDSSLDANARLYRDLIFFKKFILSDEPLIICEGKTDVIYLRTAMLSLSAKHRSLVTKGRVNVAFLNHTQTIKDLFKIRGGTGDLGNLISNYSSYCGKFARFKPKSPVIIIMDNDSGAPKIRSLVKAITGKVYDKNDGFRHLTNNLYLIQTPPLAGGADSAIEDFFDKKTLDVRLSNKKFSYKGEFIKSKHYGKNHFAEYVVKPRRKDIDFNGFNPLLDEIKAVIKHYKKS